MKKLNYTKKNKAPLLTEELFAAFPKWIETDPATGEKSTSVSITSDGSTLVLWVPDNSDEQKIQGIITAHDPAGESINEKLEREKGEARATLKTKLLGMGLSLKEIKLLIREAQ